MKLFLLAAFFAPLIVPFQAVTAKEPRVFKPASTWNLDYGEEACRLGRKFKNGDAEVLLILAKYAPGTAMEIILSSKQFSAGRARTFHYSFDPNERIEVERPLFGEAETGETLWQFTGGLLEEEEHDALQEADAHRSAYEAAERESAQKVQSFTVTIGRDAPVTMATGTLTDAIAAMDECLADLVATWGYDPAEQASLASGPEPIGRVSKWFNSRDYPKDALRNNLSGAVRFRLAVDKKGRVSQCIVQSSYSDPAFPETVCAEFMRNAKFHPARNASGENVASYWANTVRFVTE